MFNLSTRFCTHGPMVMFPFLPYSLFVFFPLLVEQNIMDSPSLSVCKWYYYYHYRNLERANKSKLLQWQFELKLTVYFTFKNALGHNFTRILIKQKVLSDAKTTSKCIRFCIHLLISKSVYSEEDNKLNF